MLEISASLKARVVFAKRALLVLFALGGLSNAMAQTPPAPRDTIYGREVTYYYNPHWIDEYGENDYYPASICSFLQFISMPELSPEYAERIEVDTPLTIIGIAACPRYGHLGKSSIPKWKIFIVI